MDPRLGLLADDLHEDPLSPATVELAIEYPLPGPELKLAFRDRDYDFSPEDLSFDMGIGVVLAHVVPILRHGLMRRRFLQPFEEIRMESRFVVIDKNGRGNVHGVHQAETLGDPRIRERRFDLIRYIYELVALRGLEPKLFRVRLHA